MAREKYELILDNGLKKQQSELQVADQKQKSELQVSLSNKSEKLPHLLHLCWNVHLLQPFSCTHSRLNHQTVDGCLLFDLYRHQLQG